MAAEWNDAESLPTDVPTLHAMVRDLRTELAATRAELAEVTAKLDRLLAVTFGRSERAKRPRTPPPDADRPPRPRHRHGRSPLPGHFERRVEVHDLTAEQKLCSCCGASGPGSVSRSPSNRTATPSATSSGGRSG